MKWGLAVVAVLVTALVEPAAAQDPDTSGNPVIDGRPVCGVEGTGPSTDLATGEPLRVATYNVLHGQGEAPDDEVKLADRLPLIVTAMQASGADVFGLQEVANNGTYPQVARQLAALLASDPGGRWEWCWFLSNPHFPGEPDANDGGGAPVSDGMAEFSNFPNEGDFREGVAIVTRFHIAKARSRRLPPRAYEAPACAPPDPIACNLPAVFDSRQLLWARIDTGASGPFDMFTTHIAHHLTELSPTTKLLQVQAALAFVDEWATDDALPDFLVGDFNSTPETDRHEAVLDAGFVDTFAVPHPGAAGFTSDVEVLTDASTQSPDVLKERIDYVFARPGSCGVDVTDSALIGNAPAPFGGRFLWPSDHFGVTSTVRCRVGDRGGGGGAGDRPASVASAAIEPAAAGGGQAPLPATGGPWGLGIPVALVTTGLLTRVLRRAR